MLHGNISPRLYTHVCHSNHAALSVCGGGCIVETRSTARRFHRRGKEAALTVMIYERVFTRTAACAAYLCVWGMFIVEEYGHSLSAF